MYGTGAHRKPTIGRGQPKQRKTVFGTHAQTAHVWAQQTVNHGRSSDGRMFFEGQTLYSYGHHHAIASFTDAMLDDKRIVLFNNTTYSPSTGAHHREARSALRGLLVATFEVPYPDTTDRTFDLDYLVNNLRTLAADYAKPRKNFYSSHDNSGSIEDAAEHRCAVLTRTAYHIHDYCTAFALPVPDLQLEALQAAIRTAFALYNDPKAVARREKAAAKRKAKLALSHAAELSRFYAMIEGVIPFFSLDSWPHRALRKKLRSIVPMQDWDRYRDMNDLHRAMLFPNRHTVTPKQWLEGQGNIDDLRDYYDLTICRRKGERLETSRCAEVPWRHAIAVFHKAQQCRQEAKDWRSNGEQVKIGHFLLKTISAEGDIEAGCHLIEWPEMLRLAIREIPEQVAPTYPVPMIVR